MACHISPVQFPCVLVLGFTRSFFVFVFSIEALFPLSLGFTGYTYTDVH